MDGALSNLAASLWLLAAVMGIVFFAAIVPFGRGMGLGLTAAPLLATSGIAAVLLIARGLT